MSQRTIVLDQDILSDRRAAADRFRDEFARRGTLVVRLMSSPGAGKTTLLQATAQRFGMPGRMAVLVGDIATDCDARRLAPLAPTVQIATGGACHLELPLVIRALPELSHELFEYLFIEDVGNLVSSFARTSSIAAKIVPTHSLVACPASTRGKSTIGR